jgi:hypothetical protein
VTSEGRSNTVSLTAKAARDSTTKRVPPEKAALGQACLCRTTASCQLAGREIHIRKQGEEASPRLMLVNGAIGNPEAVCKKIPNRWNLLRRRE